jgi:hypothetical protein
MGIKSSLDPERMAKLPDIYRRPQEGSSVVFGHGGKRGNATFPKKVSYRDISTDDYITQNKLTRVEEVSREFDNPDISDTVWVGGRTITERDENGKVFTRVEGAKLEWDNRNAVIDNRGLVHKLVVLFNHRHRRDATNLGLAAKQYAGSLVHFNICWKCKSPIKVKTACVPRGLTDEQIKDERNWLKVKRQKRSMPIIDNQGRKAFSVARQGVEYSETSEVKNVAYADCKTHYELRFDAPKGKYRYALVDGTGVDKGVRVIKRKIAGRECSTNEYYDFTTGETLKNYYPPASYRVFNSECRCKLRNDQR